MLAIFFVKAYANRSTPKRSCPVLIFNIRYNHKREKKNCLIKVLISPFETIRKTISKMCVRNSRLSEWKLG